MQAVTLIVFNAPSKLRQKFQVLPESELVHALHDPFRLLLPILVDLTQHAQDSCESAQHVVEEVEQVGPLKMFKQRRS